MSQSSWEARSEMTNGLVSKRNKVTPGRGSCRLARHQKENMTGTGTVCKFCQEQNGREWRSGVINRIMLQNGVLYYFGE